MDKSWGRVKGWLLHVHSGDKSSRDIAWDVPLAMDWMGCQDLSKYSAKQECLPLEFEFRSTNASTVSSQEFLWINTWWAIDR